MVRKVLSVFAIGLVLLSLSLPVIAQDGSGNVPMFRGNAAGTGEMPGPGPNPPAAEHWRFATHGSGFQISDAIVANGVVYFGSRNDNLYAVDAESGEQVWAFTTGDAVVSSSPVVVDGVVYVGSDDGNLYAVNTESGQELWAFSTGDSAGFNPPAVVDGVVYVGSYDNNLYAIDAAIGEEFWTFTTGGSVLSSPAVVDGVVYVSSRDSNLYAIDAASGEQSWSMFTASHWGDSSPAVVDGVVYVGSEDGNLYAVDAASGQHVWAFTTGGSVSFCSPAVVNGVVYFCSSDDNLYAVDAASGEQVWAFSTGGSVSSSPAVVDGVVYVGSDDGNLYAVGEATEAMKTATAEGEQTAEAEVNATTAAELQATASAESIEQALVGYFAEIGTAMAESSELPPGLTTGGGTSVVDTFHTPTGWEHGATYPVTVTGGAGDTWVGLLVFNSNAAADGAYAEMTGGLTRSGWQEQDVDGLDHNHTCLALVRDETSQGACYMTRDDALIVSDSFISADAPDAVLLNATDLARLMNAAYNEVDWPLE